MAVYHVMRNTAYSDPIMMKNIPTAKRYIDDGAGLYLGDKEEFEVLISTINDRLKPYGMLIDPPNRGSSILSRKPVLASEVVLYVRRN